MSEQQITRKFGRSCDSCRARKLLYLGSRELRCQHCVSQGKECVYSPRRRRTRNRDHNHAPTEQAEPSTRPGDDPIPDEYCQTSEDPSTFGRSSLATDVLSPEQQLSFLETLDDDATRSPQESSIDEERSVISPHVVYLLTPISKSARSHKADFSFRPIGNITVLESMSKLNLVLIVLGPGAWMSICSKPGISWVTERTGLPYFAESAKAVTLRWTQRLKLERPLARERTTEPVPEIAWKYCKAFFEDSQNVFVGVIDRPAFETRLHAHFGNDIAFENDLAWYALRNAVYAAGCQIELSKAQSTGSNRTETLAWQFFENALSVHTELLYAPSNISAIQALAIMSFFAETVGSPTLEYMLCSSATRLAQSKGLHRQPAISWELGECEITRRNWLFWAIYCCDKRIAYLSGRPSAIDDDDISCQVPTKRVSGTTVDLQILNAIVEHARISSSISRRLASVKAFRQTPKEIYDTVRELDRLLQQWRESLPEYLRPGAPIEPSELPSSTKVHHVLHLHYAYYGSVIAIHNIFTFPWTSATSELNHSLALQNAMSLSANTVSQASRDIILTSRYIKVDVASPKWLALNLPMFGLVNLLVHVLQFPTLPSAQSDVALMDVVAGHFGHLEYVTSSELAFPFAREVASLARMTVQRAKDESLIDQASQPVASAMTGTMTDIDFDSFNQMELVNAMEFDVQDWDVLAPMTMSTISGDAHLNTFSIGTLNVDQSD